MSNLIFFFLLGSVSAAGIGFGYPWEPIATLAGTVMGVYALIKAELSERLLRLVAKDVRTLAQRRRGLRQRLSELVRRVCRRPSTQQPPA